MAIDQVFSEATQQATRERAEALIARAEKVEALRDQSRRIRELAKKKEAADAAAAALHKQSLAAKEDADRLENCGAEEEKEDRLAEKPREEDAQPEAASSASNTELALVAEKPRKEDAQPEAASSASNTELALVSSSSTDSYADHVAAAQAVVSKTAAKRPSRKGEREALAPFLPLESMARCRQPKRQNEDNVATTVPNTDTTTSTALVVHTEEDHVVVAPSPKRVRLHTPTAEEEEEEKYERL
jgi:hypothetical protein